GEREVVVTRLLAIARARDRIEPHVVRLAVGIHARRHHPDRLSLEHGKRLVAEIENDVADVRARALARQAEVAGHGGDGRLRQDVGVDRRRLRRPRRRSDAALAGARLRGQALDLLRQRRVLALLELHLLGQRVPLELLLDGVGPGPRHLAPVVDGAGGTRGETVAAGAALARIDHVVAVVVRDRAPRARLVAGVA